MIIIGLAVVWNRSTGLWRTFYGSLICLFMLIAAANLLQNVAIDHGVYYSGGFFDTPFLLSLILRSVVRSYGLSLQAGEDKPIYREINQSLWTARIAMVAILSLPVVALLGSFEKKVPEDVAAFRLRLVFGAMLLLSGLVFWKLTLLARELRRLVRLSQASLENLKTMQARIAHSQKLAALGRLAAGATHEISNPLTAILGYSELLTDIPSLSPPDRQSAQTIQKQVHLAQAAVNNLRNSLRKPQPKQPTPAGEHNNS